MDKFFIGFAIFLFLVTVASIVLARFQPPGADPADHRAWGIICAAAILIAVLIARVA